MRDLGRRESVLAGLVIGGTAVVILTELLSALHQLDARGLMIGWGACFLAAAVFLFAFPKKYLKNNEHPSIPLTAKIFMAGTFLIFMVLALVAFVHVPNTWDAMIYHLPRVEHWAQNKTIAYYPTHIPRQDAYPPWDEWALLHLRLLTGGDYFAGLLQCAAMMASTIGVSLIARWLGAGVTGQSLAALLSACLPMGILQATSTQNDYVVTMWLVLFVYFFLNSSMLLAALSLGLAFLTKGYAYLYALPFLVWYLSSGAPKARLRRAGAALFVVAVALLLNTGYFYRNGHAFGSILWSEEHFFNGGISLSIWLANVLRNAALHLGTIYVPYNEWVVDRLQDLSAFLHIDLNPPQGSFSAQKFVVTSLMFNEDYAGNFLSALIFIFVLITAGVRSLQGRRGFQWSYALGVGGMFFLLCLALRFQPFNSRFHLAIFVLGSAWTAFVLEKLLPKKALLVVGLAVLLTAIPWLLFNHSKPLLQDLNSARNPRIQEYFNLYPSWASPMVGLSGQLRSLGCGDIGLISDEGNGENAKEYLLWVTMRWFKVPLSRLEHIDVLNPTGKLDYPLGKFNPCAVVLLAAERPSMIVLPSGVYGQVWSLKDQQGATQSALYVPVNH